MRELNRYISDNQIVSIPSHDYLSIPAYKKVLKSKASFVGGSNLLSSNMPFYRQWKLRLTDPLFLKNCILFGTGWWQYQNKPNSYTSYLYRKVLSKQHYHSVRDEYTADMLKSIGISNVINTGCPTMWDLTEEHCDKIPQKKADSVITTITDYNTDLVSDRKMLDLLIENYQSVYLWLQGDGDHKFLKEIGYEKKVNIISPNLYSYEKMLQSNKSIDYIGTRLHAGVFALQNLRRTLVIAIDNRAKEISADTKLSICERGDMKTMAEWIHGDSKTTLNLKNDEIYKFRKQLENLDLSL
jgi:polysaccharide pyruvyl transferase WcaK-like protein